MLGRRATQEGGRLEMSWTVSPLTHLHAPPYGCCLQTTAFSSSSLSNAIEPAQQPQLQRAIAERQLAILEDALKPEHAAGDVGLEVMRLR